MRNGLNILTIFNLLLQSEVYIWREKRGWLGLYKFITINSQTCTI